MKTDGGAKKLKGRDVPIRTQARVLRDVELCTPAGSAPELPLTLGDTPPSPTGKGHWRQADVKRAIAAAEKAGLRNYRVEIAPDGTISIIVGT